MLKAKLARYRAQLLEPTSKSGPSGVGFEVQKAGDARVALIGFPSVGKVCLPVNSLNLCDSKVVSQSTLLSKCTNTASESAAYEFTTLTVGCSSLTYKRCLNSGGIGHSWRHRIPRSTNSASRPPRNR